MVYDRVNAWLIGLNLVVLGVLWANYSRAYFIVMYLWCPSKVIDAATLFNTCVNITYYHFSYLIVRLNLIGFLEYDLTYQVLIVVVM